MTDQYLLLLQVNFWYQEYFHGVNLSSLRDSAMNEYFRQPIVSLSFILRFFIIIFTSPPQQVDTFDINICTAKTQRHVIDFQVPSRNSFEIFNLSLSDCT